MTPEEIKAALDKLNADLTRFTADISSTRKNANQNLQAAVAQFEASKRTTAEQITACKEAIANLNANLESLSDYVIKFVSVRMDAKEIVGKWHQEIRDGVKSVNDRLRSIGADE